MKVPEQALLEVANSQQWRSWLSKNSDRAKEIWLVFFKKHTGKRGMDYREALEEALSFGWIDGLKKGIDEDRYAYRFSPRKRASRWTRRNIEIAEELIAAGRMAPQGLAAFNDRKREDPGSSPRATRSA